MGALIKLLVSFGPQLVELLKFFKPKPKVQYQKEPETVAKTPQTVGEILEKKDQELKAKDLITLDMYLTSSGKYPDRAKSEELTPELIRNATILLKKVNAMLHELGVTKVSVSSGFRTSAANAKIANAAKKSLHMTCQAIDLVDLDDKLDELIASRDDLLKKYGLWLESPAHTKKWVHCDIKDRGKRAKNIFIP